MKHIWLLILLLSGSPALAAEALLNMSGAISYACDRVPAVQLDYGTASVSGGQCYVQVAGLDEVQDVWSGFKVGMKPRWP